MPELGEADRDFFDEHVYPHLGAEREDGSDDGEFVDHLEYDPSWAAVEESFENVEAEE